MTYIYVVQRPLTVAADVIICSGIAEVASLAVYHVILCAGLAEVASLAAYHVHLRALLNTRRYLTVTIQYWITCAFVWPVMGSLLVQRTQLTGSLQTKHRN